MYVNVLENSVEDVAAGVSYGEKRRGYLCNSRRKSSRGIGYFYIAGRNGGDVMWRGRQSAASFY